MAGRMFIHSKNIIQSLVWILSNYNKLRKQLESQGYYSMFIYKIFLWKSSAKYFKVFDIGGRCFFLKLQSDDKVAYEYQAYRYIEDHNLSRVDFYPKVALSTIGKFSYNVFEELDGQRINKKLILDFDLIKQMKDVALFFDDIRLVHRDIRPHNIIVVDKKIKIIDFEHCSINNQKTDNNSENLNREFSPNGGKWDDAYSFKKIVDYYINKNQLNDSRNYDMLSKMIGKNTYECN